MMSKDMRALFKVGRRLGLMLTVMSGLFTSHLIKGARGVQNDNLHIFGIHFRL